MISEKLFFGLAKKANKFFRYNEVVQLTAGKGVAFAFHYFEEEFVKSPLELKKWMEKFDDRTLNEVLEHIPYVNCPLRVSLTEALHARRALTSQKIDSLFSSLEKVARRRFPIRKLLQIKEIIAETGSSEDGFFVYLAGGTYDSSKSKIKGPGIYARIEGIVHYEPGVYYVPDGCGLFNSEPWLRTEQRVDVETLKRHLSNPSSQRNFVEQAKSMLKSKNLESSSFRLHKKLQKETKLRSKF